LKWAGDKIDYILGSGYFVGFSAGSLGFIETIEGSETLEAQARAIGDEFARLVTVALSGMR
jgi:hypothetical protein